ncbi:hypothetical protein [Mucilaginibacter sp. L196]|uniref:hypothetical protein n=1 Tax=Mucilaginibacter sp. L196 TaxID=1641870 RepID=UPI00131AFD1B|nr:hypothetical protein [Mucilaginibacter sp. L196]
MNLWSISAEYPFIGNLNLTIGKQENGELAVAVFLANDKLSDMAGKAVPPMLLKGLATELDEGFFNAIASPVMATNVLFSNMNDYQKGLDKAKEQSKIEQDKKTKNGKTKTTETTDKDNADDVDENNETETLFTQPLDDKLKKEERKQAYDALMKQVSELNQQCKYEEAIALMPTTDDYPEKSEEITRKLADLNKRKAMYDELKKEF